MPVRNLHWTRRQGRERVLALVGDPWDWLARPPRQLEQDELARGGRPSVTPTAHQPQQQLGLFQLGAQSDRLAERLRALDIDRLTPLEALTLLADLKKDVEA